MMYLLVVSISPPKEKIYTRTLADLTLYEITALVNLSAKTMVKFRPFLKRPTFLHPWQRVWLEEPPGRTRGEGMGARRALAWMTTGGPDRRALPRVNRHSSVEAIRSPRARSKRKRSVQLSVDGKSVWRFAMLRVESGTPGERVPKDYHVRRQLRPPCCFPFSPYLVRCRTKQRNRVPNLGRLHAPPLKSGHPKSPSSHDQPFPSILTN